MQRLYTILPAMVLTDQPLIARSKFESIATPAVSLKKSYRDGKGFVENLMKRRIYKKTPWVEAFVALPRRIITDRDKAAVLLVWNGYKPAAMVEISCPWRLSLSSRKQFHKDVMDFKNKLHAGGLFYNIHVNYLREPNDLTHFSYIASSKRLLRGLKSADSLRDIRRRRLRVGKFLGYPMSAVTAFANNESLNIHNLPKHITRNKLQKFLNFRLSKASRQEMKYVRDIARIIRRISPKLFNSIIAKK